MTERPVPARRLEARARVNRRRAEQAVRDEQRAARLKRLEQEARAGVIAPAASRITCALDLRQLYGPQVDAALGVLQDPPDVVDRWEAGTLVPSFAEVERLAELTGFLVEWFYGPELPSAEGAFVCRIP